MTFEEKRCEESSKHDINSKNSRPRGLDPFKRFPSPSSRLNTKNFCTNRWIIIIILDSGWEEERCTEGEGTEDEEEDEAS